MADVLGNILDAQAQAANGESTAGNVTVTSTTGPAPAQPEPQPEETLADGRKKSEQRVPYDRYEAATKERQAAEAERDELRRKLEEREEAELSDLQRAQKRAEDASAKLKAAEEKATKLERGGWVREAARQAGFADPADAVAFMDLSSVNDEKAAGELVTELAEKKPHLLAREAEGGRQVGALLGQQAATVPTGSNGEPDWRAGLGADVAKGLGLFNR